MQVKGLYFIWYYSEETPYLLAVSYDEYKLENILMGLIENEKEEFNNGKFIIKDVQVYTVSKNSNNIYFMKIKNTTENLQDKVYAFNYCHTDGIHVDQCLLRILTDHKVDTEEYNNLIKEIRNHEKFLENDFTDNLIKFDTYYDEGIINN